MTPEVRQEVGRAADAAWYNDVPFSRVVFHVASKPSIPAPLLPSVTERGLKLFAADPDWDV